MEMEKFMKKFKTALVIGGGAFGTSIATVLSTNFQKVVVLVRSVDVFNGIKEGINSVYLPDLQLSSNICPVLTWKEVKNNIEGDIELIIWGLPTTAITAFLYDNCRELGEYLQKDIPLVSLAKGIDSVTLELPDDLFFNFYGEYQDNFTFLSGPSFAREIVEKQVTLVTLAGRDKRLLERIGTMMHTPYFKTFKSYDVKGVLLGGALKNLLAIAGGIIEGLGYNHNTRAAMISRGIVEMLRFGKIYNARPETFYGLSGMGDLILTTTGSLSRNKLFGLEIAKGKTALDILSSGRLVVEGYKTTKACHLISKKYDIRAKIFNGLYQVLFENRAPGEVINELMMMPPKFEID